MKNIFVTSIVLTLTLPAISQTTFEVSLGNKNSNQWGYDIVESHEDGFIIVGRTDEDGVDDILFLKISSKGEIVKNQNIGGANVNDYAKSICITNNNKYAVSGMTRGYAKLVAGEEEDAFYVQIDKNMHNNKLPVPFGGKGTEISNNIIALKDGHFLISINKTSLDGFDNNGNLKYRHDCFLIKITSDGNQVWLKDFANIGETWGNDLLEAKDGKIYLTGTVKNKLGDDRDIFVSKLNSSGTVLWEKTIYAKKNHKESSKSIIEDEEGNLIIAGTKISPKQKYPLLVKISPSGEKLMEEVYDVGYDAGGNDIIQNKSGELILVGSHYGRKGFVLHLESNGEIIDQYLFKPSITKILKVRNESNFLLLGEESLESKFLNIFLKKTNLNELIQRNKAIDANIEERSKKLFYGDLPSQTKEPIFKLMEETVSTFATKNVNQEFQGELKVKIKGTISVKLDTYGKAIESNVIPDEMADSKSKNLIEFVNHNKLKELSYKPATWKGYKVNVLYDRILSEYYTISQYKVKIKNRDITKIGYSDDKYFYDHLSFRKQFIKLIMQDKTFNGDGKYQVLYSTQFSDYGSPINTKILRLSPL